MRYYVTIRDTTIPVDLEPEGIVLDGEPVTADLVQVEGTSIHSLTVDGASHRLVTRRDGQGKWRLLLRGRMLEAEVLDERTRAIREMTGGAAAQTGPRSVRAPMPGLVVKVDVEEGQVVDPGQGVIIVEAMKMENELKAETGGRVSAILVSAGQAVDKDEVLIELETVGGDE